MEGTPKRFARSSIEYLVKEKKKKRKKKKREKKERETTFRSFAAG